mgnify:FL=1
MEIIRKKDNSLLFKELWNTFIKNNEVASNCEIQKIEYYLITNKEHIVSDESFVLTDKSKECLAICFLPIYSKPEFNYIDGLAPISTKNKHLVKSFEYIEDVARSNNVAKIELSIDICFSQYGLWRHNYLRNYGYLDVSSNSHIFYLDKTPDDLFLQFNASTRKIIRKFERENNHKIVVYNNKNITKSVFLNYKKYHKICAGYQTRSDDSFDSMLELIRTKKSVLIELTYQNKVVGYLLLFLQYPFADMVSMANLPEYEESVPIYRLLLWQAIQFCSNYKLLIGGFPAGHSLVDGFKSYIDEKQLKISQYKTFVGFNSIQVFKGVKYFNEQVMIDEISIFKEKIKKSIE